MRALLVSIFLLGLLAPASCLVSESSRSFMKRDDDRDKDRIEADDDNDDDAEEGKRCSTWDEMVRFIEISQKHCRGKGNFAGKSMDRCLHDKWNEDVKACIPLIKACGQNEWCPSMLSDTEIGSGPCPEILNNLCTEAHRSC
eukprot:TRINITY_DN1791_c0_g1_i3.p1 TRINITY_DN1791_c0_g1~~TRINITY_DN1791_c0_g1_i3.p1  ORF type:complete len:142 (+),score=17.29 TRINITY_DN1791_c0_g1_i3:134-559(+)